MYFSTPSYSLPDQRMNTMREKTRAWIEQVMFSMFIFKYQLSVPTLLCWRLKDKNIFIGNQQVICYKFFIHIATLSTQETLMCPLGCCPWCCLISQIILWPQNPSGKKEFADCVSLSSDFSYFSVIKFLIKINIKKLVKVSKHLFDYLSRIQ